MNDPSQISKALLIGKGLLLGKAESRRGSNRGKEELAQATKWVEKYRSAQL